MSADLEFAVKSLTVEIKNNARARAGSALNILRNSAIEVLSRNGTGRVYKRGGRIQIASAAGQPPAPDYGNLRKNWSQQKFTSGDLRIHVRIKSRMKYFSYLQEGTRKMARRPIIEPVKKKAKPEIVALFSDL